MSNVLVVDIGTQSMRGIIFDEHGNLLVKEQIKYKPYLAPENGFMEQDQQMYEDVMFGILRTITANHPDFVKDVVAVSVDAFRDTTVLLDEHNKPVRNTILWSDQRTADVSKKLPLKQRFLFKLVGMDRAIRAIRRKTKSRWVQQHEPEVWARVKKVVCFSAYMNSLLVGKLVDCYASSMGHIPFDNKGKKWMGKHSLLFPVFDLTVEQVEIPLFAPGEVMGYVTAEAAAKSGLPEGLRVIASGSDKGCETIGVGCLERNTASVSFGTSSSVQFTTDKYFEPEPFMPAYPSVLRGYYNPEVQIFRGYWMISWFKKNFAEHLMPVAEKQGRSVEELMNDEIVDIPAGCDGLVLQPFWQGGLTAPEARGAIIGFSDFHTRAHVYRAIIEGIDFALREGLERMERRGRQKIEYISVSGGGSQSNIICQIAADIFNRPVRRVQTYETSGLGAAIVTFVATGVHKDVRSAINEMVHYKDTFTPNPDNAAVYDDIYKNTYLKLYGKLQRFYLRLDK